MNHMSKLLLIFLIIILSIGCERKNDADVFVSENLGIHENVKSEGKTHEELPYNGLVEETALDANLIISSQDVEIIIKYAQIFQQILYVDQNITQLYFLKDTIVGIEGLEQLPFLDTLIFDKMAFLENYSFLSGVPNLKRLFISGSPIDWSVVELLPNLEVLHRI